MNRKVYCLVTGALAVATPILCAGSVSAQTQTPGQVAKFDPALSVVDSVITEANGNIGIGITTPAAKVDVAAGNVNIENSTASSGNILKSGFLFLHNFGTNNTFLGQNAGNLTMGGFANTASGVQALKDNITGNFNTAHGASALMKNTTGIDNTATGAGALQENLGGQNNTAIGFAADVSSGDLTNATAVGNGAVVNTSNKIRLGNTAVSVIEGQVPYTFTSDKNQKENFQSLDGEAVLRKISGLSLTSWNYIGHDPKQFRHYGPMAQDFFAAFGHDSIGIVGTSTTINSGDLEGILLVAVQTLEKRTAENAELRARIEALERLVKGTTAAVR
jgi:hypothetical protein